MPAGRPPMFDSPKSLQAAIDEYFAARNDDDPATITGLALELGFADRQSLNDYQDKPEYTFIVKKARSRVALSYEQRLRGQHVAGPIFALKNMGWRDAQDLKHSGGMVVGKKIVEMSDEELAAIARGEG